MSFFSAVFAVPLLFLALLFVVFAILLFEIFYIIKKRRSLTQKTSVPPAGSSIASSLPNALNPQPPQQGNTILAQPQKQVNWKLILPLTGVGVLSLIIIVAVYFLNKPGADQSLRSKADSSKLYSPTVTCLSASPREMDITMNAYKYGSESECLNDDNRTAKVGARTGPKVGSCNASSKNGGEDYSCSFGLSNPPDCSAFQIDCPSDSINGGGGAIGWNCNNCNPPPTNPPKPSNTPAPTSTPVQTPVSCLSLNIPGPNAVTTPGEKKIINLKAKDGKGPYTWKVEVSQSTGKNGSITITKNGDIDGEAEWIAPANLINGQVWTFTATVTDGSGKSASSQNCQKTASYSTNPPSVTPTLTPGPSPSPTRTPSPTITGAPSPTITSPIPQCISIKFYRDTTYTQSALLTIEQLKDFHPGDKFYITVVGNGSDSHARYREVSKAGWVTTQSKIAGTNEFTFSDPYELPAGQSQFLFEGMTSVDGVSWH